MIIRKATIDDFCMVYTLGKSTPELKVSASEEFMDEDELKWSLNQPYGIFLIAEEKKHFIGFIYASIRDIERPYPDKYACIVYLVVHPDWQRKGIGKKLYEKCIKELKTRKITYVYAWANPTSGIIPFLKKQGLKKGHPYVWMDKKI